MSTYIGAIASLHPTGPKYLKEDFNEYVANPQDANAEADMMGAKCMTVGINDTFMPTDKENPSNLDMAQYNIRDRFGYNQDEEAD